MIEDGIMRPLDVISIICDQIFSVFPNLLCLKFEPFSDLYINIHNRLTCETRVPFAFFSSNLTELHINVDTFTDCLFLLDGRFK